MNFGLTDETIIAICAVLTTCPAIESAILYGSRAMGTHKPGSDIDLTLTGNNLTQSDIAEIAIGLDDLLLPYQIDLSILNEIDNPDLRAHINRVGKPFYRKNIHD